MRFFCLCMSPAIDALVKLPSAPKGAGEIFKDVADEENVGGKTINVARWLALRGAEVVCGGLLGEDNAALFKQELEKFDIGDAFVRVSGSTRRNEMVTWPGGSFKINRAAFPKVDVRRLKMEQLLGSAVLCDVAILSGSLPKGAPPSFYADCISWLKKRGVKTVLDASGEALRLGVAAGPDVIKPNAEECEPLVGFVPKTPEEFHRATEILRTMLSSAPVGGDLRAPRSAGGHHVIISDGGAGAWFNGEFVSAPKVEVVDTTAAGDTLLAEWCWRAYCPETISNISRWAVAAGSAACTMPGSNPPDLALVENLARQVEMNGTVDE